MNFKWVCLVFSFFSTVAFGAAGVTLSKKIQLPRQIELSSNQEMTLFDLLPEGNYEKEFLLQSQKLVFWNQSQDTKKSSSTSLQRNDLAKIVRESDDFQTYIKSKNMTLRIPEMIEIRWNNKQFNKVELQTKIGNALRAECGLCEIEMMLSPFPPKTLENWKLDLSSISLKNSLMIPLYSLNANLQNEVPIYITGKARIFKKGFVVNKLIQQGEKIQEQDLEEKLVDISQMNDGLLEKSDIIGRQAIRMLSVQTPVISSVLKKDLYVKRGQSVKVVIGTSDFEISTTMAAESDGNSGDTVKVRNLETQKIFSGTVIDRGTIKVE